ncbi:MAG TPA: hypothetical protein VLJ20_00165 [Acetobacteraceae bacterium]|nr:hypothetical protein [Acetobacteraceae bacterium]
MVLQAVILLDDHELATALIWCQQRANCFRHADAGKISFQAAQQIAKEGARESQETERFGAASSLHETEFTIMAEALEAKHELIERQTGERLDFRCVGWAQARPRAVFLQPWAPVQ